VTTRIIADLERGVRPWFQPWHDAPGDRLISRPLRGNGVPYRGINVLLLWAEAVTRNFTSPTWLTYRQAQALGAQVRRGEKGTIVVYADRLTRQDQDDTDQEREVSIPFVRAYTVFNAGQIDGLPETFQRSALSSLVPAQRLAHAERFIASTGAVIEHGGNHACYIPSQDRVLMPVFERFHDREAYYGTLIHELIHWTGHSARLDRTFGQQRWGDQAYALEELVAEIGAAFICTDLALTPEPRPDHASYIAHWLQALQNDSRFIFAAAAHAQRAADFLHATISGERGLLLRSPHHRADV
jgi:antirestriction protein ArdC